MHRLIFRSNLMIYLVLLTQVCFAGGRENGGGNWLATEFRDRARFIIHKLNEEKMTLLSKEQIQTLIASVADTRVELSKEELVDEYGGSAKAVTMDDPKRPGKKLIKINEPDWSDLLKGDMPGNSINIVFHEYLRSIDIADFNEFTSSQLNATEEQYLEWIKTNRRAEDNVIRVSFNIAGDLIPADSNVSVDDQRTKALASYAEKSRAWRESVNDQIRAEVGDTIGIKGVFIEKSRGIQDHHIRSISERIKVSRSYKSKPEPYSLEYIIADLTAYDVRPDRKAEDVVEIGLIADFTETVQIHFDQNRSLLTSSSAALQTEVRYWKSVHSSLREGQEHFRVVYDLVHADFAAKCAAWKNSIREQLGPIWTIVYLDCGIPSFEFTMQGITANEMMQVERREKYSSDYMVNVLYSWFRLQGYQMRSRPTIYYLLK